MEHEAGRLIEYDDIDVADLYQLTLTWARPQRHGRSIPRRGGVFPADLEERTVTIRVVRERSRRLGPQAWPMIRALFPVYRGVVAQIPG